MSITKDQLYDIEFRNQLRKDPASVMKLSSKEYKVLTNSKDTVYITMPDEETYNAIILNSVSAAGDPFSDFFTKEIPYFFNVTLPNAFKI